MYMCVGREDVVFSELSPAFPAEKKKVNAAKKYREKGLVWMGKKGLECQNAGNMLYN